MKTKTQEEDPLLLHIFLSRHPNLRLLYLHDPKVFLSDFGRHKGLSNIYLSLKFHEETHLI